MSLRWTGSVALAAILWSSAACPPRGPWEDDYDSHNGCLGDGHGVDIVWPDCGPPGSDLEGRWALLEVASATINVAGASASETLISTYALLDLESDDAGFKVVMDTCFFDSKNIAGVCGAGSLVETVLPQPYADSLPETERHVTVGGDLSFHLGQDCEVRGAELDEPCDDPLPGGEHDPQEHDQDGDGHPGMSIDLRGLLNCQLYVAQRDWTELLGEVVAQCRIEGSLTWSSEQVVFGSKPESCKDAVSEAIPNLDKSWFLMVRVPDEADCEYVDLKRDLLFPNRPK